MQKEIKNLIKDALKNLNMEVSDIVLEHPADLRMGDYSTSMAMAVAKNIKTNPQELAQKIITEILRLNLDKNIEKVEEKNGFINFYLSRKFFSQSLEELLNRGLNVGKNNSLFNQKIMVEYTDPNPFKPFHIGHLMTNAIGESIARILEHSGAVVSRANYQGDIGLHVAKAIYGLSKNKKLQDKTGTHTTQSANIGKAYANGAEAYEKGEAAKLASAQDFGEARKEIDEINKKLYDKSDEKINEIYDWGFKVTMEAFEDLYKLLGTKFDFYFLESKVAILGQQVVRDNIDKLIDSPNSKMIFEKSEGAVVFKAEKYDPKLHTRVFITSKGLPTYETKELGLTEAKFTVNPNTSLCIVITANEQTEYMKVVTKALSLIHPDYASKMKHITHGMMRLTTGKMSSRKGNIVTGESLIRDTIALVFEKIKDRDWHKEEKNKIAKVVGVAALKYSILKQSIGGDILYDFEKSISFEGDSGPYLQYAYARAKSVIAKAQKENILPDFETLPTETFEVEKMLYKFPEVVFRSASEYKPHYIANYLIEVARSFNSFYGNIIIVDKKDKTSSYKIALTYAFTFVMKTGLHLLGIQAPEKM
ncbi:arginine--tRNA ligase [Candidatus Nomurabacteria bacterium RIFCSPHIGHO2_01_FULL_38_19]|uniref:Arginine--tRNA ligase n=1 Tax=Candidatus Nomurabacteria bacterium RIFCSPHIGHO2_01_FULL_38_19 TaxID=1801732 RepID=A0A1F6UUS2_9BACT|nr:MAG: arginine--tRNA ligase [Candidatus Nomurabacteria bacterium RIFCSPHIGHO2_01_FULL_38_19]